MSDKQSEIIEIDNLISIATFPAIKSCLKDYKQKLLSSLNEKTNENVLRPPFVTPKITSNQPTSCVTINDFAWDQGEYNSPTVTIYIDLNDVGTVKDKVDCKFTSSTFELTIIGLNGKNYKLYKDNLDKDIIPEKSNFIVKKDKIVIKLAKVKGEYSYESWTSLTSKKSKEQKEATKKDPMGGIMGMMKDMYDEGDDNMKKIIGEAMMKAQRGEKSDPPSLDGLK